jgi:P27 family predicted phage terminase small subunit
LNAPKHLKAAGRAYWKAVTEMFEMEEHHLKLLQVACEALDRAEECRLRIAKDGVTVKDRFGIGQAHPLLPAERGARAQFLQAARDLGLDEVPAGAIGRPPGR